MEEVEIYRARDSGALCARLPDEKHYVLSVHSCERHEDDDDGCLEIRFLANPCQPNEEGDVSGHCTDAAIHRRESGNPCRHGRSRGFHSWTIGNRM